MLVHPVDVVEKASGAASRGDDGVVVLFGGMKDLGFQFAVKVFVVFSEEVIRGDMVFLFKEMVGVVPIQGKSVRQFLAGGGLACAHISDEEDSHVA